MACSLTYIKGILVPTKYGIWRFQSGQLETPGEGIDLRFPACLAWPRTLDLIPRHSKEKGKGESLVKVSCYLFSYPGQV